LTEQKPKYANHIFKGKIELPIDSVAFVVGRDYHICDRHSFVRKGEDPRMVASFIFYPRENKMQLRFAFKGDFHIESPTKKDTSNWVERVWIAVPMDKAELLTKFLTDANPAKIASYM
jgi:hypothetical protein